MFALRSAQIGVHTRWRARNRNAARFFPLIRPKRAFLHRAGKKGAPPPFYEFGSHLSVEPVYFV